MTSASPSDSSSSTTNTVTNTQNDENLERKRARDRKSQRAMRERTKWSIQYLTAQVQNLTCTLEQERASKNELYARFLALSEENDHLRVQKAALQLRLLGGNGHPGSPPAADPTLEDMHPYEATPLNTNPACLSDQILQSLVERRREVISLRATEMEGCARNVRSVEADKIDLSALFDGRPNRNIDETSAVVGDIVRSYIEIDTLPKQVGVHYIMSTMTKWLVLKTKESFDRMPPWLRPELSQLERPHPSWIDRVPWPKVRTYLIDHPEITLDDFASAYSTSFFIRWDYDAANVIIAASGESFGILINPIYEEHMRQIRNWSVGDIFRRKFPEMSELVDSYSEANEVVPFVDQLQFTLPRYAI